MTQNTTRINFARNFYKSKSLPLSSQNLINMYAEIEAGDARTQLAIFNSPGLEKLIQFDKYLPIYAMEKMGNYLYVVVGSYLYQIDKDLNKILKGTIPITHGKVKLSSNGYQLTILTQSGESWVYNKNTDVFAKITDVNYQLASDVTFYDGYTIFSKKDSDQFFYSQLLDSTSFNGLDFQTAEWNPDNIVGLTQFQGQLWIFGTTTTEVYQNTGGNLVFTRIRPASQEIGCNSRDSIAKINSSLIFLGDDRLVYQISGYNYNIISTTPIIQEFEKYTQEDIERAEAFTYTFEGHKFYAITFPTVNKTFEYDITTQLWLQRESYLQEENKTVRWLASCINPYGKYKLVGDYKTGVIYNMKGDIFKEGNNPLISTIISSPMFYLDKEFSINALYIDMETGIGITSGQGEDPKLVLYYSKDGGRTYDRPHEREIGKIGEYRTKVKFKNIGTSDNFTFKIVISDPIPRRIYNAFIDIEINNEV
jgi:hypothetical protein